MEVTSAIQIYFSRTQHLEKLNTDKQKGEYILIIMFWRTQ